MNDDPVARGFVLAIATILCGLAVLDGIQVHEARAISRLAREEAAAGLMLHRGRGNGGGWGLNVGTGWTSGTAIVTAGAPCSCECSLLTQSGHVPYSAAQRGGPTSDRPTPPPPR